MTAYEPDKLQIVDDLNAFPSKKLKFHVWIHESGESRDNVYYGITGDKPNKGKSDKAFVLSESELNSLFHSFVSSSQGEQVWSSLLDSSLYGLHYRTLLSPIEKDRFKSIFHHLVYEQIIRSYLLVRFPSILPLKEIRLAKTAFDYQDLRNALAIYVAPYDRLVALSRDYSRVVSETEDGHKDRVNGIFPCRLSDILALARSTTKDKKKLFLQLLQRSGVREAFTGSVKMDLHFHVDEVIFPGVTIHWQGIFSFLRHEHLLSRSTRISSLSSSISQDLSILFTYIINKAGTKIEIDVPGGKRDLGETPLECMYREVWEEIGFHPKDDSISLAKYLQSSLSGEEVSIDTKEWVVWQQEEDPTITSFVLCDRQYSLSSMLPAYLTHLYSSPIITSTVVESLLPLWHMPYPSTAAGDLSDLPATPATIGTAAAATTAPTTESIDQDLSTVFANTLRIERK